MYRIVHFELCVVSDYLSDRLQSCSKKSPAVNRRRFFGVLLAAALDFYRLKVEEHLQEITTARLKILKFCRFVNDVLQIWKRE